MSDPNHTPSTPEPTGADALRVYVATKRRIQQELVGSRVHLSVTPEDADRIIAALATTEPRAPETGDWPEGNYIGRCVGCGRAFEGHKRQITCRLCSSTETRAPEPDALAARVAGSDVDLLRDMADNDDIPLRGAQRHTLLTIAARYERLAAALCGAPADSAVQEDRSACVTPS